MKSTEQNQVRVVNPEIVDETKRVIVVVGCEGLTRLSLDTHVTNDIAIALHYKVEDCVVVTEYFEDRHPLDQVKNVEHFLERTLKKIEDDDEVRYSIICTNSPFVLQSFFHFSGRGDTPVSYYECSLNDKNEVTLTDVSHDTRETFTRMAQAMDNIMSWTEYHRPAGRIIEETPETRKKPRYIRFYKELDYWFGEVTFDDKNYDQLDDDDAWDNFREDFPSLLTDNDEFQLIIDIIDGKVINWPEGHTGDFYTVKIVDTGHYDLIDGNRRVLKHLDRCVPEFLSIREKGWGDYLEFEITKDGFIKDWHFGDEELDEINKNWNSLSESADK